MVGVEVAALFEVGDTYFAVAVQAKDHRSPELN
jgi:hypothetical protein